MPNSRMLQPISPTDLSAFFTPPSTPRPPELNQNGSESQRPLPPVLKRRSSDMRPQSLTLDNAGDSFQPDVIVEHSPETLKSGDGHPVAKPSIVSKLLHSLSPHIRSSTAAQPASGSATAPTVPSLNSPCFVHSGLDKFALFNGWLQSSKHISRSPHPVPAAQLASESNPALTQSSHNPITPSAGKASSSVMPDSTYDYDDEEDDSASNLTRRLAETAVGVREMSKQLGRARVHSNIQSVLIITKARDNKLIKLTRELALYLMLRQSDSGRGLVVYVDAQLRHSKRFDAAGIECEHPELFRPFLSKRRTSSNLAAGQSAVSTTSENDRNGRYPSDDGQLRYWTSDMCTSSPHLFDFVVTLGGDGTVLYTSWLFQRIVPPVLPFALGSLGFLTNFDFKDHQAVLDRAIESGIRVNLRMRFTCTVYRAIAPRAGKGRKAVKKGDTGAILMKNLEKGGWEALEGGASSVTHGHDACKDKEVPCYTTRPAETFEILNDLVVDRGLNSYLSLLELFGDEHHMTTVQADGLCIATPTGSTAYSLAAGGSLVNPEIPAILITPICPHTLSFRPMLLPDTMELRICVPYNSRSSAWASFDGRGRIELKQGDHLKVTASKYPFPTVCAEKQSTDWFHSISRTLKWNERERQKSFVVVEEDPTIAQNQQRSTEEHETQTIAEAREDEEEEEDETFDIDDLSGQDATSSSSGLSTTPPPPKTTRELHATRLPHSGPRHARFTDQKEAAATSGQNGERNDNVGPHAVHLEGERTHLPQQRDRAESMRTPRVSGATRGAAFAVYGRDESNSSNASDGEAS